MRSRHAAKALLGDPGVDRWIGGSVVYPKQASEVSADGILALLLDCGRGAAAGGSHSLCRGQNAYAAQPYGPMDRTEAFVGYALWAVAQQWLLQGYFFHAWCR